MVVSRTDIRYSKVTFIVNLRALYVVTFQHNQMIAENRISGVGPIVLILSWGIQRRLDSYHVTFSTNEIALFWHCFCETF